MTRDAAAQAAHERMEQMVATMSEPDVEAGWTALLAQLEPPAAPVVPIRRHRPRRVIALGVAAAMLVAGGALAMVRHGGNGDQGTPSHAALTDPGRAGMGPHGHPPLSGPPAVHHRATSRSGGTHHASGGSSGGATPPSDRSGGQPDASPSPPHHHGDSHSFHQDSPDDTDHGTGNDGTHDDNGQGNDAQGPGSQGQDTQGNGNGSSGGAGGQGSGAQGSGDREAHASGGAENPESGSDSNGSHGQGQDHGGRGSHG